jgi:xylulokinase
MGVTLSAGGCLRWFKDTLGGPPGESFGDLLDAAATVPPGALNLAFLPYLAGERAPPKVPHPRGGGDGHSLAHPPPHQVRAPVEGVGFALRDCLERMRALSLEPPSIVLVGGGARSPVWRRMLAAQLALTLETPASEEGPAQGAAMLALVGAGLLPDLAAAVAAVRSSGGTSEIPDPALTATYDPIYRRWTRLYPALKAAGLFEPA